ncbi:MAG: DUF305 domain-containing protein [Clostridia bacterium]|nr:DUF305 domain-containing protein [Clostridia bacterium]
MECREYLEAFDEILCTMKVKMLSNCFANDITTYFIKCMIPHHRAAIYMCENLLQFTDDEALIHISKNIIKTQMMGIKRMQKIYETTAGCYNPREGVNCYVQNYMMITKNMVAKMRNAPRCEDINLNFVNEMIPHHEGAIAMCDNLIKYYIDPRLGEVARSIIEEQSRGVENLKQIHKKLC